MNMLLAMEHIGKSFSGVRVLDDVRFNLRPGEVHILAGENGAGKTTLIKILSGVHTDYEGKIRLEGEPVRFRSPHEATLRGISVIHQEMSLVNAMRVVDNIFLGRECARKGLWMDFGAERERAGELLKALGVEVDLDEPLERYPFSVRQMVEVAKALVFASRIIVMDEPTSALSDPEVERLFSIIGRLTKKGCGVIFITHRLEEIFRVGDRITVLRDGKHIDTVEADKISAEELIRLMVGREITQQFPRREARIGRERLMAEHFHVLGTSGARRWAVEDVTLKVYAGEIVGIAGLQGSGKSELLNGLFGALGKRTKGAVYLDGTGIKAGSPRHSIQRGLVLQTNDRKGTGLVPMMDIPRNISLPSVRNFSPSGLMRFDQEEKAAQKQVASLGIRASSLSQEVRTLSGGNQQKVVLAKWLETKPKVLLLDEPTLGVDVGAKHEIYELMNRLTADGLAILLITSELAELLAISDRILVMHRGRVTAEFGRGEATQENVLRAAMGEGKAS